jgi:RNA polymerase sigma-70 factor (ECF subfamily)
MNPQAWATDEQLLDWSSTGDEEAFAELFRRRQASIYRFALHMSGRDDIAEEVTQEVFLAVIRAPERFDRKRGSCVSFLFGIARNHVLRMLEQERAWMPVDEEGGYPLPADSTDLLADLTRAEAIEAVRLAVLTLPAGYREVVALCDLEELDYSEAAASIGVPVGTVRSRLSRARGLLVEKLRGMRCST